MKILLKANGKCKVQNDVITRQEKFSREMASEKKKIETRRDRETRSRRQTTSIRFAPLKKKKRTKYFPLSFDVVFH